MKSQEYSRTWTGWVSVLGVLLLQVAGIRAAPIAYDDLEGAALGSLGGQTSGTGFAAGYVLGSGAVGIVTNQSLSYSNGDLTIDGGTNCILIVNQDKTVFTRAIGTRNDDDLYLSFLFQTPTADGASEDFFSFGFNNSAGETTAGVIHRLNSTGTDHYFGLRRSSSSEKKTTLGTTINQTYFVVLRLRKLTPGATSSYNELSLFVDPSSVYEPAPTLVFTNTAWAAATHIAARIASAEAGDRYYIDNLCIGRSYEDVVFPNGSPIVVAPSISPAGGDFEHSVSVSLATATDGASIRYTTDGSTPSSTVGVLYASPFTLTSPATVRAVAYKDEMYDSPLSMAYFRVARPMLWKGLAGGDNWSATGNWSPAGSPAAGDLMFGVEDTTTLGVINNVVDASMTISSLSYTNLGNTSYHVTQIAPGVTLTVDGGTSPDYALYVGRTTLETKTTQTRASMTGGGVLAVNAPESGVQVTKRSKDERGQAYLDMSELSACTMTVRDFTIGRYDRGTGFVTLPRNGLGATTITAARLTVGDSGGGANGDTSSLTLGPTNTLQADRIGIGGPVLNTYNENSGLISFAAGLQNPSLTIRGSSGGLSRADLTLGSHGTQPVSWKSTRSISGTLNTLGGTVDAQIGSLVIGKSRGMQSGRGGATGTLSMDAGSIDAESVVLGWSDGGDGSGKPAVGTLSIAGGRFAAGTVALAKLTGGAQMVSGRLNVSAGLVQVGGDMLLGPGSGTATSIVATVALTGGDLNVGGRLASAVSSPYFVSSVILDGGQLHVTNAAASAEFRIENGTFAVSSGTATLDRLVLTNALTTTRVELRGTGGGDYGHVTVNEEVRLGGRLTVTMNGYAARGGDAWTVVAGAGTRTGTFATADLPEGMRVVYTDNGFIVARPAAGSLILLW